MQIADELCSTSPDKSTAMLYGSYRTQRHTVSMSMITPRIVSFFVSALSTGKRSQPNPSAAGAFFTKAAQNGQQRHN